MPCELWCPVQDNDRAGSRVVGGDRHPSAALTARLLLGVVDSRAFVLGGPMSRFAVPPSDRRGRGREVASPGTSSALRLNRVGGATSGGVVAGIVAGLVVGIGASADATSGTALSGPTVSCATVNSGH